MRSSEKKPSLVKSGHGNICFESSTSQTFNGFKTSSSTVDLPKGCRLIRGVAFAGCLGINNHNIDIDSARTLLGAAVLATAQANKHPKNNMMKASKLRNRQEDNKLI